MKTKNTTDRPKRLAIAGRGGSVEQKWLFAQIHHFIKSLSEDFFTPFCNDSLICGFYQTNFP